MGGSSFAGQCKKLLVSVLPRQVSRRDAANQLVLPKRVLLEEWAAVRALVPKSASRTRRSPADRIAIASPHITHHRRQSGVIILIFCRGAQAAGAKSSVGGDSFSELVVGTPLPASASPLSERTANSVHRPAFETECHYPQMRATSPGNGDDHATALNSHPTAAPGPYRAKGAGRTSCENRQPAAIGAGRHAVRAINSGVVCHQTASAAIRHRKHALHSEDRDLAWRADEPSADSDRVGSSPGETMCLPLNHQLTNIGMTTWTWRF
jgi:hypothetical protein